MVLVCTHHILVALLFSSLQSSSCEDPVSSLRTELIGAVLVESMTPPATSADERPLVLLAQPLFPEFAAALSARYRLALAADADAATVAEGRVLLIGIAPATEEHLAGLPALELVAGISVGVDHVDLAACRRRGLSVTNAGAAFAVDSADYAVGLVVAYVRGGRWVTDGDYPLTTKVSRSTIFFRKSRGLLSSSSL
jgi:hydroxypyruvate reductase 2